ncbi:Retrovirus-related Pol polyprotein from transposon-like protein [Leptotrombidium deliense]|uniref:Retrovirus-related Pol polyprotein from transposon-like protein n=1 Tax=Leptotrombidium deliense TaxID=299467 RepID=A0A443RVI2_9ACAR|nr:Retrovirus-related Pol polyprotein from transposon-like protein [Leptotrombidium deliense]
MFTSIYHPEANGAAERLNRSIKQMLTTLQGKWDEKLPYVNFAYNTAVHEATGRSPFEAMYGRNAVLPSDLRLGRKDYSDVCTSGDPFTKISEKLCKVREQIKTQISKQGERQLQRLRSKYKDINVKPGELVLLNIPSGEHKPRALNFKFHGPYRIVTKINENSYEVESTQPDKNGNVFRQVVHAKFMKPSHVLSDNLVCNEQSDSDNPRDPEFVLKTIKEPNIQKRPRGRPRKLRTLHFAD